MRATACRRRDRAARFQRRRCGTTMTWLDAAGGMGRSIGFAYMFAWGVPTALPERPIGSARDGALLGARQGLLEQILIRRDHNRLRRRSSGTLGQ